MRTRIEVGIPKFRARPPTVVRPPTEVGEASLGPDYTVVDDASDITTGYTHAYPSNIAAGDKILLAVYSFYGVSAASGSVTAAGFTVLQDRAASSDRLRLTFFERTADGTEDSNTTITVTGGTPQEAASMMWFVKSGPIDYSVKTLDSAINADKNNHDPPAVTVSHGTANYLVFAVDGWYNAQLDAAPTNYTFIRTDDPPTGKQLNPRISVAYQLISLSTSEDPGVFTVSNTAGQEPYLGTIAVLAESTAPVASGDHTHDDHTHTESDVTDLDHWTEADHDALDHTGLTGVGGVTDHGALTGLGDDDHTLYTKADGSRAFTGPQSMGSNKLTNVTDPTAAQDAATKAYVDANQGATILHGAAPQSDGSLRFRYGVDASGRPTYTAAGTTDTEAIVILDSNGRAVAREVTL